MEARLKNELKRDVVRRITQAREIRKIVVFESFVHIEASRETEIQNETGGD